jgi:hypothetical protein
LGGDTGGFFGSYATNGTVCGNCINNAVVGISQSNNAGGFFGARSLVNIYGNCINNGAVQNGGGFAPATTGGNISFGCINNGNINDSFWSAGFFGGYSSLPIIISNFCINNGSIPSYGSGFVGGSRSGSSVTIFNGCVNNGSIGGGGPGGGFSAGGNSGTTVIYGNCINNGSIGSSPSGGFVGGSSTGPVTIYGNCINNGTVSSAGFVGGERNGSVTIYGNCVNNGNIITQSAGGFIGVNSSGGITADKLITITNCINNGNLRAEWTGGIIGRGNKNISLTNCVNTGSVSGTESGGLISDLTSGNIFITNCCNAGSVTNSSIGFVRGIISGSNPVTLLNISTSQNVGDISGGCAGFIGSTAASTTAVVGNCYSTGNVVSGGFAFFKSLAANTVTLRNAYAFRGVIADSSTFTSSNVYAANGAWSDITANSILLNTPVDYTAGNIWISIAPNTPYYFSSSLIRNLYSPNSETIPTISNYTTNPMSVSNRSLANPFRIANVSYTGLSSYGVTIDPSNGALTFSGTLTTTDINYYVTCMSASGVFPRNYNYLIGTYALRITGLPVVCFKEGSKILTNKGYVAVENLRRGDLIKTSMDGYIPLFMIGKRQITHSAVEERIKDQLYKCSSEKYPELFEDLIITGCHSILIDTYSSEEEREKTIEVNGDTYVTDEKYRLPACADERATVYENVGEHTIYHFALENPDYFMNYGIYANGLLVETCSQRYLKELSMMELIE